MIENDPQPERPANPFVSVASALYDGLLVLAVLMVVTLLLLAFQGRARVSPLTVAQMGIWGYLYRAVVAVAIAAYFGSTWTYRGQTLGMKAWRVRLIAANGHPPKLARALVRLVFASLVYVPLIGGIGLYMKGHGIDKTALLWGVPFIVNLVVGFWGTGGTLVDRVSGTQILRGIRPTERG
jgi:uncharacterized RDD family membrane protein YckC